MTSTTLSASTMMMKGQLATNGIHTPAIVEAMLRIDRSLFVPESLQGAAYADSDIPIASGRYMLEPLIFARMLEYANILPTHNVLDVGAGYGYSSAVISCLSQNVVAVEESETLVSTARTLFASLNIRTIDIIEAPMLEGCDTHKPYDRIIIEGAVTQIPTILEDQLAENAIIVGLRLASKTFATQKALADIVVGVKRDNSVRYVEKERVLTYHFNENGSPQHGAFIL